MLIVLDEERAVLSDLHAIDERVFNYLAELMDWGTGQIGFMSSVSFAFIAGALSEDDLNTKAKRLRVIVTRLQVKQSVDRMVDAGLFERHSVNKQLRLVRVFWVELVAMVKSVKNQDVSKLSPKMSRQIKKLAYIFNGLYQFDISSCPQIVNQDVSSLKHTYLHTSDSNKKFAMSYEWRPDQEKLKQSLALSMIKPEQIDNDWFAEFVRYWSDDRSEELRSESQWLQTYVKAVVPYVRNPALFFERNGYGSPAGKSKSKSKVVSIGGFIPKVPFKDDELNAYAEKYGLTYPCPQHLKTYADYRELLNIERTKRMDQGESDNYEGGNYAK